LKIRTAYRSGPACVAVETDDRDASRWLAEFVTPWFEPCSAPSSALTVSFTASRSLFDSLERRRAMAAARPASCFALDSGIVALPGWTEGDATIVADAELGSFYRASSRRVEMVARPDFPRARIALMRVVRELLMAQRRALEPLLDLHAAAFGTSAGAVVLAGPKKAGKTTLLAHFLRCGENVSLIANDRVLVDAQSESPIAFGVPVLVSIREGTLELFPELRRASDEWPVVVHSAEKPAARKPAVASQANFGLTPAQFAERCGSATAPSGAVVAIVFPEVSATDADWSLVAMTADAALPGLVDAAYGRRAPGGTKTVFEAVADDCAAEGLPPTAQVARLASAAPVYRCRVGLGAYRRDARELLQALVGHAAAEHGR
jgi:hypothetical protein